MGAFGCLSFPRLLLRSLKHAGFSPLAYGFPGFLLVMTRAVALLTCPEIERVSECVSFAAGPQPPWFYPWGAASGEEGH